MWRKGSSPCCVDPIFVSLFRPLWDELHEMAAAFVACAKQGTELNPHSVVSIFVDCPAVVQISGKRLGVFLFERFHLTLCTHGDGADLVTHLAPELCTPAGEVVMLHIFTFFGYFP